MLEVAELMYSLREEDIELLYKHKGERAWEPLFDLVRRMIYYLEAQEDYPGRGLDILRERLVQAQERLYGLITASSKVETPLMGMHAKHILASVHVEPAALDCFIARYIVRKASN